MARDERDEKQILPEAESFLERLGVRSCDSDFEELGKFMRNADPQSDVMRPAPPRWQDKLIEGVVEERSSILDIGCGEGDLLLRLAEKRIATVQGVELNQEMVIRCIERGIPVYHGDLETSLKNFPDENFDYVILEETLQTLEHPMNVLKEMMRVGKRCFISFPNFAHWNVRLAFSLGGRMPKTGALPYTWYDTPNIHLCSINDFMDWTASDNIRILNSWVLANGEVMEYRREHNLVAEQAMFLVEKA
ncbi:MAG: methionine biosynthesis protein MetW [Victivallales bacterium]|nr:methionine biosynthesis protein MetW [Victivallales bacterium]